MSDPKPADFQQPVVQLDDYRGKLREKPQWPDGLKEGEGGGTFGGMPPDLDKRVTALENKVDQVRVEVAELKGKVSQLPTVWTLVFANLGLAFTVAVLVFGIARAMK